VTRDDLSGLSAVDLLTLLAWGEARGEPLEGQAAVLNVVHNRVMDPHKRFGLGYGGVILKPWQFSCLNEHDPNLGCILDLAADLNELHAGKTQPFAQLAWLAGGIVAGVLLDNTYGATHYCSVAVNPSWAIGQNPTVKYGRHVFFKL
jgi:spore germination cell wall hydrolase CwlJ-like protein